MNLRGRKSLSQRKVYMNKQQHSVTPNFIRGGVCGSDVHNHTLVITKRLFSIDPR